MTKRNLHIDIIRAIALLWVVIYHIWVLSGATTLSNPVLFNFIKLGGEIGVTLFFILSGYGIYFSLRRSDETSKISFFSFMKKRLIRLCPEYYLSIIFIILFTPGATYISFNGSKDILTHLLFIHNIRSHFTGSINGVLWTMAVIFQFYIIAIPMYYILKKTKFVFPFIWIAITILSKYTLFHILGRSGDFWASRQLLPSVIDNFALGMFLAYFMNLKIVAKLKNNILSLIGVIVGFVILFFVCDFGLKHGIHVANLSGYLWHTEIAICCILIIFFYSNRENTPHLIIEKCLLWISKYEYGIYIVHLIIIQNLLAYSSLSHLGNTYPTLKYIILIPVSIFAGWMLCICGDGIRTKLISK